MLKKYFHALTATLLLSVVAFAQTSNNAAATQTNPSARRSRTTTTKPAPTATPVSAAQDTTGNSSATGTHRAAAAAGQTRASRAGTGSLAARGVRDAFDTLINGIRRGDVDEVMGIYWNSPRLILFNNNGTVTKTWEQVHSNRQSSYAKVKDVKLDLSDDRVMMLGRDAAIVTARWKQSQTFEGKAETSSGRMTVVFQNIAGKWRAVHAHTSPDRPDPTLLMPSERTTNDATGTPASPIKP
ncbi:MAG: nuclear transport factor 2 family protein [Pyrinomonadaceae bacterium]